MKFLKNTFNFTKKNNNKLYTNNYTDIYIKQIIKIIKNYNVIIYKDRKKFLLKSCNNKNVPQ